MSWSGLAKFVLGFLLGIFILVGASAATGLYFLAKLSVPPPKPMFPEEKEQSVTKKQNTALASKKLILASTAKPIKTPTPPVTLEPGAYKARVTWPDGLILRASPSFESNNIGGVSYNQQVVVLQDSDDKQWQKVRLQDDNQEGWIKAGNIERVDTP